MAQRSFLAIFLCLLVLFSWPAILKRFFHYPIENKEVTNQTSAQETAKTFFKKPELAKPQEIPEKKPLGNVASLLLRVMRFLHNLLHNWGLAIIALSVLIGLLFYPFTLLSMKSMKRMQSLQPQIEALRQKYKNEPQKLNKEIMQLYRQEKVNPFGGCLPLIFQIPVFMGLYQMLMRSEEIKGAKFLWIKDLSKPEHLNIAGISLNLLPIFTALLMFLQQRQSLKMAPSGQAEQQKMMAVLFPVMFGFIFYNMPSGLVLYWLVNSMIMFIPQLRMAKHA